MTSRPPKPAPQASPVSRWVASGLLRLLGWRIQGRLPALPKYIAICYPHTSNWDFFYFLVLCSAVGMRVSFMAKRALFKPPLGWLVRALGGIPIDRARDNNVVDATIRNFRERDTLVIGILPEGTRAKTDHWKSGFYRIAVGAGVPIVMFSMDFPSKRARLAEPLLLSGDEKRDMDTIRAFYAGVRGYTPENASDLRLQSEALPPGETPSGTGLKPS